MLSEKMNNYLAGLDKSGPQSAPAGMSRMQAAVMKTVACPTCGGDWLFEINLQQYRPGYSSAAGGDLQPISESPQTVRMCPCGTVIPPNIGGVRGGHTPNAITSSLLACLTRALATRAEVHTQIAAIAQVAVEQGAFDDLKAKVEGLEKLFLDLTAPSPQAEAAEPPAKKSGKKGSE